MLPKTYNLATPRQRYYIRKAEVKYDVICACLNKAAIIRWIGKYKELDALEELENTKSPTEGVVTHGSKKPINPTF